MKWYQINEAVTNVIAYHGTSAKFDQFDHAHLGSAHGTAPSNMAGFHFTNDPEVAASFGATVKQVRLHLDNPVTINAKGQDYSSFKHILNTKLERIDRTKHDGLIVKNYVDAGIHGEPAISTHYIVFDASKIHSNVITEAPIAAWDIDPDFQQNRQIMNTARSKRHANLQHWDSNDIAAMNSERTVARIRQMFARTPYKFNFYLLQATNPDYDGFIQKGEVDIPWVEKTFGQEIAARVSRWAEPDAINVIFSNNMSDEGKISLRSPWMVAHRLVHSLIGGPAFHAVTRRFEGFIRKIISVGYGRAWPEHPIIAEDYLEAYGHLLGHALGTMRSARSGNLVQTAEWYYETVTQFLLTGKITFNPLPKQLDEFSLTNERNHLRQVLRAWHLMPKLLEADIDKTMHLAMGKIWVE